MHRTRRKDTMGQLSKQKVELLRPLVTEKLSIFLGHVQQLSEARQPVNILAGWRCLTLDIISDYAFGQCLDALKDPNFKCDMIDTLHSFVNYFFLVRTTIQLMSNVNPVSAGELTDPKS